MFVQKVINKSEQDIYYLWRKKYRSGGGYVRRNVFESEVPNVGIKVGCICTPDEAIVSFGGQVSKSSMPILGVRAVAWLAFLVTTGHLAAVLSIRFVKYRLHKLGQ